MRYCTYAETLFSFLERPAETQNKPLLNACYSQCDVVHYIILMREIEMEPMLPCKKPRSSGYHCAPMTPVHARASLSMPVQTNTQKRDAYIYK